ncbi:ornithine cyclodeaminase [Aedoeadaptatus ivorii]|uniref:Ornithine cyclodeaminase n=1 Tax=Aedoeadaptatus ivorii TaxID=54006 RepID=A0A448V3H8_9FIRM|nr:ornithine cyclodeaminase family protein [Peptoniphilus ivorii]VEJ36327.1 ornithine cyclodeaminase [Peptoniphilus ivorii]
MEILVLNGSEVRGAMSMREWIEADKSAAAMYSKKQCDIPLRTNIDVKDAEGQALFMPGVVEGENALGIKIVSVYPNNAARNLPSLSATVLVMEKETGAVKGILDGTELTKMRTGALAGAATDLLARKDAKTFLLIGTGGQAESQLEAVLAVRDIQTAYVFNRKQEKAEAFVEGVKEHMAPYGAELIAVSDLDGVIENADVITAVTTAKEPVFEGSKVKAGCHINGMGAYTPEMIELDPEIVVRADKVFLDTVDGVMNEAGDMMQPVKDGRVGKEKLQHELGELVLEAATGRESDEEITVFKSTGSAVFDIVTAEALYQTAKSKGIGSTIAL